MPPQTRAVFINYQTPIRVGATPNSIIRSWSDKTAAEKAQWLAAYWDCMVADNDVAVATAAADAADVAFGAALAVVDNDPNTWELMMTRATAAEIRYEEYLMPVLTRQRDTWMTLHGLEVAQPRPDILSLNHAMRQRNAAVLARRACTNSINAYKRIPNHPPVPWDANGQRKMPANWVGCSRSLEIDT